MTYSLSLFCTTGKPWSVDITKIKGTAAATAAEELPPLFEEDDPYGLAVLEESWRPARIGAARRNTINPDKVQPGHFVIMRGRRVDRSDTSCFCVGGYEDAPLWLCKVLDVITNSDGEAVKWKVSWYTSYGKGPKAKFSFLGTRFVETIDVDIETAVATTPYLTKSGFIPKTVIKEAIKVIQSALTAENNGNVRCVKCDEDKEGEPVVYCGCCSKLYHVCCVQHGTEEDWWCDLCL